MSKKLIQIAKKCFNQKTNDQIVHLANNEEQDRKLNDLKNYPHMFVLACIMDKQIKAERAWGIPHKICMEFGSFKIKDLAEKTLEDYKEVFDRLKLHRFNKNCSKQFYLGVKHIVKKYNGDSSRIWCNNPSSASVVFRFLEFHGVGIKIATMAANILARQFKIPFSDLYSIDISPDIHIRRIFYRMGFIQDKSATDMIIYKARELNPEFPGIIDFSCWKIGRNYCYPQNPNCSECPISSDCKKII